ncbi:MAG TPA: ABC transporter ATP-binding protein [Acidimicrobiales bacterium]|jgi:osmoprotectant transport system ATP-binding protein|nr:ABC transporter ATP-binding protein [Acidimicrobiales bacterium]
MISLSAVTKRYDSGNIAVDALSLEVVDGEICVLVGPSGCGKTTTLRMINRLIEPSDGHIFIDGRDVLGMNAVELRRGIGYVIQQGGLFPHRRVEDNVAVVPRLLGWDKQRTKARVAELLDLVGLPAADYARRYPHELSGGERQRVGVARALGADPPVLLMDEPFGAVDPITRLRLQNLLLGLQKAIKKTIVMVTHDIDEAAKLGDRIAVLSKGGHLEQLATPPEILGRPATPFVAEFVGDDRGVKRLAVVDVKEDDLIDPPACLRSQSMADVAALVHGSALPWAVVVDDGVVQGWVKPEPPFTGTVGEHLRPFPSRIPLGTSLHTALAELLQHDAPAVPVFNGNRYLGVLTFENLHVAMRRSLPDE